MNARRDEASAVTANKERTTLSVFWKWARKEKLTRENPVENVERYEVEQTPPVPCPEKVYQDFVRALRREAREDRPVAEVYWRTLLADVLEALWWAGIRVGELCRVTNDAASLNLRERWFLKRATLRKGGTYRMPIPDPVLGIFRRRAAIAAAGKPLFGTADGKSAYHALYLARRRWLAVHPEHKAAKFHALRHAHEDRSRAAGIDAVLRSKAKGHKSVTMTAHYSHPNLAELRKAQRQLARATRSRPPK